MTDFDARRALLVRGDIFPPFRVRETRPLRATLDAGGVSHSRLSDDTPVVVPLSCTTPVALLKRQLAYHHVAQGEADGEPWLASF